MDRLLVPAFAIIERSATNPQAWGLASLSMDMEAAEPVALDWTPPANLLHQDIASMTPTPPVAMADSPEPQDLVHFVEDGPASSSCGKPELAPFLVSEDPLVVYIPSFLSPQEAKHIVESSEPGFRPSQVYSSHGVVENEKVRLSDNVNPPRDAILRCIEQRSRAVQEWDPARMRLEAISVQRYRRDGFFSLHHDFFGRGPAGADRVSTFNVFVQGDCKGGGTHFPLLKGPVDPSWCRAFLDCEAEPEGGGLVFRPIAGNAIYWENVQSNGTGHKATLHQSLPIESGTKITMNIWTWLFPAKST